MTWRGLPSGIPTGKIVSAPTGILININRQRFNILCSTDAGKSWNEVYSFAPETEHVHGAQGPRDIVFGFTKDVTP